MIEVDIGDGLAVEIGGNTPIEVTVDDGCKVLDVTIGSTPVEVDIGPQVIEVSLAMEGPQGPPGEGGGGSGSSYFPGGW